MTSHMGTVGAVTNMVTVEAKGLLAATSRTDRNIGAALFRCKHREAKVGGNPEAESRAGQERVRRGQVGGSFGER